MSVAGQTFGQPVSRSRVTSDPAYNMRDVMQKAERHRDPAIGANTARCPHQAMSSRVNVTADDGDGCHAGLIA
jgi:hypothetical protein